MLEIRYFGRTQFPSVRYWLGLKPASTTGKPLVAQRKPATASAVPKGVAHDRNDPPLFRSPAHPDFALHDLPSAPIFTGNNFPVRSLSIVPQVRQPNRGLMVQFEIRSPASIPATLAAMLVLLRAVMRTPPSARWKIREEILIYDFVLASNPPRSALNWFLFAIANETAEVPMRLRTTGSSFS